MNICTPKKSVLKSFSAFTLIELLVVITIIGILMALLFPAIGAVMEMTRKVQAKNDMVSIVNAVKHYYTEYGKYPIDPATAAGDVKYSSDNNNLFDVLRNITSNTLTPVLNARQIVYLEVPDVKNAKLPKRGIGITGGTALVGGFYDPWGALYNVALDGNYDNQINPSTTPLPSFYTDTNFKPINTGVIAWSFGRDGTQGTSANNTYLNSDDVTSWQ